MTESYWYENDGEFNYESVHGKWWLVCHPEPVFVITITDRETGKVLCTRYEDCPDAAKSSAWAYAKEYAREWR